MLRGSAIAGKCAGPYAGQVLDDDRVVIIELAGQLAAVYYADRSWLPAGGKKSALTSFSNRSRLGMFKMLSRLEWPPDENNSFITLTCRDDAARWTPRRLVECRWNFWKRLEYEFGQVPNFWRVEYEVRESGLKKGEVMPHFHFLAINCPYIHYSKVAKWWREVQGVSGYVRVEVKRIKSRAQAGYYISKYVGKLLPPTLVIATYLATHPGRHWGVMRKSLMPFAQRTWLRLPRGDLEEWLRAKAKGLWRGVPDDQGVGYTLLGQGGEAFAKAIRADKELDCYREFG